MATDLPGPGSPIRIASMSPAARRAIVLCGSGEGAGRRRPWRAGAFAAALLLCAGTARAEPQASALRCLALNVYWEARSSSPEDQRAVAHVTLNRVASPDFPGSICAVVRQGGEARHRCQFSWRCDGKPDRPENPEAWRKAVEVARQALAGEHSDPTHGALFFHHASVRPDWADRRTRTVRIGPHVFYR
jgi:spore germination cell wall hydrolase CwlJ-like protein